MGKKIEQYILDQIKPLKDQGLKTSEISKKLNISDTSVLKYLKSLGINVTNRKLHTLDYSDALKLYLSEKLSVTKFCKKYNLSMKWFLIYLNKQGINVINEHNRVKFNDHKFDIIDTEEKAYWLGFIYADGCVMDNNGFEISLKESDKDHLDKFNTFMEYETNNVKINSTNYKDHLRCRWSVKNKHLKESLEKLGCTPRKSLTLSFPNKSIFTNEELIRHFIRGYFDGDGCISYSNKEHTKMYLNFVGTKEFLNKIKDISGFNWYMNSKGNVFQMSCGHTSGMKFSKCLYENSTIYLDRKYQRFVEFCRLESSKNGES